MPPMLPTQRTRHKSLEKWAMPGSKPPTPGFPTHLILQPGHRAALLVFAASPKLSTCEQHQGLLCGGTAWVSEWGLYYFPTGDLKHSWVVARSCSRTLFPTGVHPISSCKGK